MIVHDESGDLDFDAIKKMTMPVLGKCRYCDKQLEWSTWEGKRISVTLVTCDCAMRIK